MNSLAITFAACFLAVYSVSGAHSLMCYNCTYVDTSTLGFGLDLEVGKDCKDPFQPKGISSISCDGSCVVRILEGTIVSTQRTCMTAAEGECYEISGAEVTADSTVTQKCCTADNCNGASLVGFSLAVVTATLLGALYAKY